MSYLREEAKVVYESKDGKHEKVFNALEWLAAMTSHIPEKGGRWSDTTAIIVTSAAGDAKS